MPKVYAREKGIEYRVGNYGTATHDRPALVPPAVADELASSPVLRVEDDGPAPRAATKKPTPETPAPEAEKE